MVPGQWLSVMTEVKAGVRMELELSQACIQAALSWHRAASKGDSEGKGTESQDPRDSRVSSVGFKSGSNC